jgi:hypothetical protein
VEPLLTPSVHSMTADDIEERCRAITADIAGRAKQLGVPV